MEDEEDHDHNEHEALHGPCNLFATRAWKIRAQGARFPSALVLRGILLNRWDRESPTCFAFRAIYFPSIIRGASPADQMPSIFARPPSPLSHFLL